MADPQGAPHDTLVALMNGREAGVLEQASNGRLRFSYDPNYQGDAGATPVSLSMPVAGSSYGDEIVRPYLWGLLPDNETVLERWGRSYQVSARNPFALLRYVGEDCAGAVQLVADENLDALTKGTGGTNWLTNAQIGDILRELEHDPAAWHAAGTGQFSLAGAQAKTALYLDPTTGKWGAPWGAAPTTHILKPQIAGFNDHDINEHLSLEAVRRSGLPAAKSSVHTFSGERAIVLERYDRHRLTDGPVERIHQEDMCQALAVMPTRKYQNEGGPSPEQIAKLLKRSATTASTATRDITALLDGLAANWVLGATDAHAKNFSVLLSGREARLAPLYDLASALPYEDMYLPKLKMAMKIGGEYRLAYIRGRHWRRLAEAVGLDSNETIRRIERLCDEIPAHLADAAAKDSTSMSGSDMPQRLAQAVTGWAAECRAALRN